MTDGERFPEEQPNPHAGADSNAEPVAGPTPSNPTNPVQPGSEAHFWWSREAQQHQAYQQQPYPQPQTQQYQQPQQSPQTNQYPVYPPGYPYAGGQQSHSGTDTMVRPKPAERRGGRLVAGAVAVAVIAGGIGGGVGYTLERQNTPTVSAFGSSSPTTVKAQPAATVPGSVQQVAAKVLPSVVQIQQIAGNEGGEGSGVVLSSDGLILTNNHVVAGAAGGAGKLTVTLKDGTSASATIVGRDPSSDIAVIKMANQSALTPITIGSSSNLSVGQDVVAVGSPLGLAGTVTSGIVSALNRPVRASGEASGQSSVLDAIQTDAAINPGNSGGALVNMNGELIGINSAIASLGGSSSTSTQSGSIGLGFAIPVDQAQRVAQELIAKGQATQAVLGVSVTDNSSRAASTNSGATIAAVTPGGAADKAGITADSVVTKLDDRVIPDGDSLVAAIRSHVPGDTVTLTIKDRSGATRTVQVTLQGTTVKAGN
jgi:putative serine protease PepD